jgi:hypothetical protein
MVMIAVERFARVMIDFIIVTSFSSLTTCGRHLLGRHHPGFHHLRGFHH